MKKKHFRIIALLSLILFILVSILSFSGCATIGNGTTQAINVKSKPEGATVSINPSGNRFITPYSFIIHRNDKQFSMFFSKKGYQSKEIKFKAHYTSGAWFDILPPYIFFGPGIVDALNGAMYYYSPAGSKNNFKGSLYVILHKIKNNEITYYAPKKRMATPIIDYAKTDSNFGKSALQAYNSNSPYIYNYGAYTYKAIPMTTTASGCKLISVIRQMQDSSDPNQWTIVNYKICGGNIKLAKDTNMSGWDVLPEGIKPVINNVIAETRQYGKASAKYYQYKIIGRVAYSDKGVRIYVLNGIKLEAIIK